MTHQLDDATPQPDLGFPIIDYHVHVSEDLTLGQAVALAQERRQRFGIVEHPGSPFGIENDDDLRAYIARLRQARVYAGLQPMYVGGAAMLMLPTRRGGA